MDPRRRFGVSPGGLQCIPLVFVAAGLAPTFTNNIVTSGPGGVGGNFGNAGPGKDSYAIFDADPEDGLLHRADLDPGRVGTVGTMSSPSLGPSVRPCPDPWGDNWDLRG